MFYQDIDDVTVSELVKYLHPQSFASFWCVPLLILHVFFLKRHAKHPALVKNLYAGGDAWIMIFDVTCARISS